MIATVSKSWQFQASHVNPYHPGHCSRLHGHTYTVRVWARGPVHETGPLRGMVVDFADLSATCREVNETYLDHRHLNDTLPEVDPTTVELLAAMLLGYFNDRHPEVFRVRVGEGATAYAEVEL